MSKARLKVKVSPKKSGSGAVLARVPVTVAKNDNPSGDRLYQTKAQVSIRIKTTRNGKPRIKSRF